MKARLTADSSGFAIYSLTRFVPFVTECNTLGETLTLETIHLHRQIC